MRTVKQENIWELKKTILSFTSQFKGQKIKLEKNEITHQVHHEVIPCPANNKSRYQAFRRGRPHRPMTGGMLMIFLR